MKKSFLVLPLLLGLACNFSGIASPAAQTGLPGDPTTFLSSAEPQTDQTAQSSEAPASGTPEPAEIIPVPVSSVVIGGVPYQAYQIPGDPFRFVCQEPCPHDPQYMLAEYAGFRAAHAMLIQLTGVDTLAELQPVDMHLGFEDSECRIHPGGFATMYTHTHQAFTCTDGPGLYATIEETIQMAPFPDKQYFPLHEYMHTIFFGRISEWAGEYIHNKAGDLHDFVVPIPAYAYGGLDSADFCSYRFEIPPGDFGGWLINELCQRNGFQLKDLALSLIELDNLVQSGGGQVMEEGFKNPVPTVAQYRDILNRLLGSDTTPAFAAACWPPELFGNSYSLTGVCYKPTVSGTPTQVPKGK
jgi:hypothetical protein